MKNADSIGRGNALLGPESVLGSLIDWKRNGLGNGTEYELNGGGMRVCVNGNAWVEWRDVGIWDNADLRMLGNPGLGENEKGVLGMAGGFLNAGLGNVIMGECGFNIKRTVDLGNAFLDRRFSFPGCIRYVIIHQLINL